MPKVDQLIMLRDHIRNMDSKSGDADLLTWAIEEILRLTPEFPGLWFHEKDGIIRPAKVGDT